MILSKKDIELRRHMMKDYPADLELLDGYEELRAQRDEAVYLLERSTWSATMLKRTQELLFSLDEERQP